MLSKYYNRPALVTADKSDKNGLQLKNVDLTFLTILSFVVMLIFRWIGNYENSKNGVHFVVSGVVGGVCPSGSLQSQFM